MNQKSICLTITKLMKAATHDFAESVHVSTGKSRPQLFCNLTWDSKRWKYIIYITVQFLFKQILYLGLWMRSKIEESS